MIHLARGGEPDPAAQGDTISDRPVGRRPKGIGIESRSGKGRNIAIADSGLQSSGIGAGIGMEIVQGEVNAIGGGEESLHACGIAIIEEASGGSIGEGSRVDSLEAEGAGGLPVEADPGGGCADLDDRVALGEAGEGAKAGTFDP